MTPLSLTEDIVLKKLSQLKLGKSPGLNQLHPRILYETRDVIAYPLYLIFNKSLQTGILPSDWKTSRSDSCSQQESCAVAKMTAQCAPYMGAMKIFWTP